jgi:hypothetical protein
MISEELRNKAESIARELRKTERDECRNSDRRGRATKVAKEVAQSAKKQLDKDLNAFLENKPDARNRFLDAFGSVDFHCPPSQHARRPSRDGRSAKPSKRFAQFSKGNRKAVIETLNYERFEVIEIIFKQQGYVAAFHKAINLICDWYAFVKEVDWEVEQYRNEPKETLTKERAGINKAVVRPLKSALPALAKLAKSSLIHVSIETEQRNATKALKSLIAKLEKQYAPPRKAKVPKRSPASKPYESQLGRELMRFFVRSGFDQRRGDFTKTNAATYAVAFAASKLLSLSTDSLKKIRTPKASMSRVKKASKK